MYMKYSLTQKKDLVFLVSNRILQLIDDEVELLTEYLTMRHAISSCQI